MVYRKQFVAALVLMSFLCSQLSLSLKGQNRRDNGQSYAGVIIAIHQAEQSVGNETIRSQLADAVKAIEEARVKTQLNGDGLPSLRRAHEILARISQGVDPEPRKQISEALRIVDQLIAGSSQANSQQSGDARTRLESGAGLLTLNFRTPNGNLKLNLPDDLTAGDTISGSVVAEPAGQNKDEIAKNQDELSGYVVDVEKNETKPNQTFTSANIPPTVTSIPVVLKDKSGNVVDKTEIPVDQPTEQPPAAPEKKSDIPTDQKATVSSQMAKSNFDLPKMGQPGRPIQIRGPFDGNLAGTIVLVGGKPTKVLAESPRKTIAQSPRDVVGSTDIEVKKNGLSQKGTFRNISVRLSAPDLKLLKGQQTTLTVSVNGLSSIQENVPLVLDNRTPAVVSMEGGDKQLVNITPKEINGDGYNAKRTLTGIQTGGFVINASLRVRNSIEAPGNLDKLAGVRRESAASAVDPEPRPPQTEPPSQRAEPRQPSCQPVDFTPDMRIQFTENDFTSNRLTVPANFRSGPLTDQYGSLGVYFGGSATLNALIDIGGPGPGGTLTGSGTGVATSVVSVNYSETLPRPGAQRSGSVTGESISLGERSTSPDGAGHPILLNFRSLQSHVALMAGHLEATRNPGPVTADLIGYGEDGNGNPVALSFDRVTLPPGRSFQCMEVRAPAGRGLRSASLEYTAADGSSVSDLRWMTDLKLHRSNSIADNHPPVVTITTPTDGSSTTTDVPTIAFAARIHEDIALRSVSASLDGGPAVPVSFHHPVDSDDSSLYEVGGTLSGVRLDEINRILVTAIDTGSETGSAGVSFWAGRTPSISRPSARFSVRLARFHVNHETWDDVLSGDGIGDEVFFLMHSATVDSAGQWRQNQTNFSGLPWIGQSPPNEIRAGNGSSAGGLVSGDDFTLSGNLAAGAVLFIGTLTQGDNAAVIFPNLWERDENAHALITEYRNAMAAQQNSIASSVANLIRGSGVRYPNVFFGGIRPVLRLGTSSLGERNDRPIGMTWAGRGDYYHYIPQMMVLTYDAADQASHTNNGMITVHLRDDEELMGDYTLYLQVQRLPG